MQRRFATGQMSKVRQNKNVFNFYLKVFRLLHNWISGGGLFHTTGAHTLKVRRVHTVLVLWNCHQWKNRQPKQYSRCIDTVWAETVQVRRCSHKSHVERKNGQLVGHPTFNGQPVKWPQNGLRMSSSRLLQHHTSQWVLQTLQLGNRRRWCTVQYWVAVVNACSHDTARKCVGNRWMNRVANSTSKYKLRMWCRYRQSRSYNNLVECRVAQNKAVKAFLG